jgi:transcription initiation factor IIE alpha subunit
MAMLKFGSWWADEPTPWEERLEYTSNYVIEKTGMTRQELKKLLQYLYNHDIIR